MKLLQNNSIINTGFITNGLLLLVPGLITSLAIVFISSNVWHQINKETSLQLLQLIQFQMLGLTIGKFGVDQTGFALLQNHSNTRLSYRIFALYRAMPLTLVFSCVISFFVGIIPAIILFFTITLEVYSVIVITELNVAKKYHNVSAIMLAGYPLLFGLVLISSLFFSIGIYHLCLFLLFASCTKVVISSLSRIKSDNYIKPELHPNVVLQQVLNYLLFRLDQILIFSLLLAQTWFYFSTSEISRLVYMAKYPELINGVLTAIWVLFLPQLTTDFVRSFPSFLNKHKGFLLLVILSIIVVGFFHYKFGQHTFDKPWLFYFCFFLNAVLAIPVNMVTFHFLKSERLSTIISFAAISLIIGALVLGLSIMLHSMLIFICIVPCQLVVYVFLFFKWKKK